MKPIIKFPTLITESSNDGFKNQLSMIKNAVDILERYNNRDEDDLVTVHTRGKIKEKVIKHIITTQLQFGDDRCLLLKIEEFKKGLGKMYLASENEKPRDITAKDKLGSTSNYAMLYPIITRDEKGNALNRWAVFIYAAADKDDNDIVNTVKNVISKILGKRFLNVINTGKEDRKVYPWVSVILTSTENVDNEDLRYQQYVVSAKNRRTKEILYQNIPTEDAEKLKNEEDKDLESGHKKIFKFFTSEDKRTYLKYAVESDEQGRITSTLMGKYSYHLEVENVNEMYEQHFMEKCFSEVLTHFLANE